MARGLASPRASERENGRFFVSGITSASRALPREYFSVYRNRRAEQGEISSGRCTTATRRGVNQDGRAGSGERAERQVKSCRKSNYRTSSCKEYRFRLSEFISRRDSLGCEGPVSWTRGDAHSWRKARGSPENGASIAERPWGTRDLQGSRQRQEAKAVLPRQRIRVVLTLETAEIP